MVDSWEVWADDFKPFHKTLGNNPVGFMTLLKVVIVLVWLSLPTCSWWEVRVLNAFNFVEWISKLRQK
jgi:hypothetical protein